MVPFAGYELPVQFKTGIKVEHIHTRGADKAGLFDVSHMGQIRWVPVDQRPRACQNLCDERDEWRAAAC